MGRFSAAVIFLILAISILPFIKSEDDFKKKPKIVGGEIVTNRAQFPYQVSFLQSGNHFCGGSIIGERHVLTAAHCCDNSNYIDISRFSIATDHLTLDDRNKIVKKIKHIFIHEDYKLPIQNDICLIEIEGSFGKWTTRVAPIKLNSMHLNDGNCNVSGWGVTQFGDWELSNELLYVSVPIVNFNTCKSLYYDYMTDEQICAGMPYGDKGSCQGDSGGPLVCNHLLTGIVSYGVGCGEYPAVYTEVAKHFDWIIEHMYKDSSSIANFHYLLSLIVFLTVLFNITID